MFNPHWPLGFLLNPQQTFDLDLYIPKKDRYVLILNYFSAANGTQNILFNIGDDAEAIGIINHCQYR